jgi:hypothetical protein
VPFTGVVSAKKLPKFNFAIALGCSRIPGDYPQVEKEEKSFGS